MTSFCLRYQTESNRRTRFCRPLPSHSAMVPFASAKIQLFFNVQTLIVFFFKSQQTKDKGQQFLFKFLFKKLGLY